MAETSPAVGAAAPSWLAPGLLFVLLWSTGFIGAKLGLPYVGPFLFLGLRFALAALLLAGLGALAGARWPASRRQLGHLAVTAALMQAAYLGGVFVAIDHGMPAGLSALVVSLQPILTALAAGWLLGERVGPRQWLGLVLGLAGVVMVLGEKLGGPGAGGVAGVAAAVVALFGITAGTIYQKRFCGGIDLRTGNAVQFLVASVILLPLAPLVEPIRLEPTADFLIAFAWSVVVLSVGAIALFYELIRRGDASRVASLMYLVPPCTAVMAFLLFGERLGPLALAGMAVVATGVALAAQRK